MRKRVLSLLLAMIMICTMLPQISLEAEATTALSYAPYAQIEYGYTTETPVGTIRYMSQIEGHDYFDASY